MIVRTAHGALLGASLVAAPAFAAVAPPVTNGLIVGLDASDVSVSGSAVMSWNDQSGLGNHAVQGTAGRQPTLAAATMPAGTAALEFDGADDYLEIASSASFNSTSGMTWFVVFNADAASQDRIINTAYGDVDPDPGATQVSNQGWATVLNNTSYRTISRDAGNGFQDSTTALGTINFDDSFIGGSRVAANGLVTSVVVNEAGDTLTLDGDTATTQFDLHNFTRIGAGTTGLSSENPGEWFDGLIAEILVYNRALSDSEIGEVNTYLHGKHLVPEPASAALAGLGLLLCARRHRR